jgi:hypothetical protein
LITGAVGGSSIQRSQWRVVILSSLGGALEFYDFVVYSMFSQYIGAAFFPATDPPISLVYSFSVFAVGYIARPVGVSLIPLFACAGLFASLCNGTMSGVVADLFPTRIRFSGIAFLAAARLTMAEPSLRSYRRVE